MHKERNMQLAERSQTRGVKVPHGLSVRERELLLELASDGEVAGGYVPATVWREFELRRKKLNVNVRRVEVEVDNE